jgi:hypothetical protein
VEDIIYLFMVIDGVNGTIVHHIGRSQVSSN